MAPDYFGDGQLVFLSFFLLTCCVWDSGEFEIIMASLLPFFGWAVLPNVSGMRSGDAMEADIKDSMPRLSSKASIMA
jgi:hypothetical protein